MGAVLSFAPLSCLVLLGDRTLVNEASFVGSRLLWRKPWEETNGDSINQSENMPSFLHGDLGAGCFCLFRLPPGDFSSGGNRSSEG